MNLKETVHDIQRKFNGSSDSEQLLFGSSEHTDLPTLVEKRMATLSEVDATRVKNEFFGWGAITPLLEKENLFEIIINGPDNIFYEDSLGFHHHDDAFLSLQTFRNFIDRLASHCQFPLSVRTPFTNGQFQRYRIHMSGPPVSEYPTVTLRCHQRMPLKLQNFVDNNILQQNQLDELNQLLTSKKNILIVGNTGSGKTTLLNSLLSEIPNNERLVVLEDTAELTLPNAMSCRLLTRDISRPDQPQILQDELVRQSLRMRPDRLIMGEVRGPEAKDLLLALATGHSGSMGTLHANSPDQALYRLEMLIQLGAPQWDITAIRRLIQLSLSHLVVIKNQNDRRWVEGIYKISGLESFGFLLDKLD